MTENMTTDIEMKIAYSLVLKQLQHERQNLEARGRALDASIESLKRLVSIDEQPELAGLDVDEPVSINGRPVVPPGFFENKTPTEAYRDLMKIWPRNYRPPEIADALQAGGMKMQRTKLLQAVHSVLKREREKVGRNGNGNGHGAD